MSRNIVTGGKRRYFASKQLFKYMYCSVERLIMIYQIVLEIISASHVFSERKVERWFVSMKAVEACGNS